MASGTSGFIDVAVWMLPVPLAIAAFAVAIVRLFAVEIEELKRDEHALWKLAHLDSLTRLPNRLLFEEALRDTLQSTKVCGGGVAVALIDVDHFKDVNDTIGHDGGDELLKLFAARLRAVVGGTGMVVRLGGDEFAVIVDTGHELDEAALTPFRKFEASLSEPFKLTSGSRFCSASIGIALFPRDGTRPKDVVKNADLALYRAKVLGRGRISIFSPDLRQTLDRKAEMLEAVQVGIAGGQFQLYFQPIVSIDPDEPLSFEALLRWHHPVRGMLTPEDFDEVFTCPSVAAALGDRVVDMAIAQAAAWQADGLRFGRVAFNVSTADFGCGGFVRRLADALVRHGVAPEKICVELTEGVFLGVEAVHVRETMQTLNALGVEIALDDFGTGYASLLHVKSHPIGKLKIDRRFVADLPNDRGSMAVVHAIAQLGRDLGVRVTAGGVEDDEQLVLLKSMGCGSFQGYYFSRPLPADEIGAFVSRLTRAA
jgi:diguanylate cyclase (GGDEF)-like protein